MPLVLSSLLSGAALVGLAMGPASPADSPAEADVPVQSARPSGPPTLPEPPGGATTPEQPEPDPAPSADAAADVPETPSTVAAPTVVEPPQPEPAVDPAPATVDPIAPSLPMTDDDSPLADRTPSDRDWVTVRAPRWRGTGMYIGAGGLFLATLAFQAGDGLLCGNCGIGITERIFLGTAIGLSVGAGAVKGHADAYDDTALRRTPRRGRRALITGAVLTGFGVVLGLVNEGMWWSCQYSNTGPYVLENGGFFGGTTCRYGVGRGLLDVASASTAVGGSLLSWSLVYRRDTAALSRARVISLRPNLGTDRFGLNLSGRF